MERLDNFKGLYRLELIYPKKMDVSGILSVFGGMFVSDNKYSKYHRIARLKGEEFVFKETKEKMDKAFQLCEDIMWANVENDDKNFLWSVTFHRHSFKTCDWLDRPEGIASVNVEYSENRAVVFYNYHCGICGKFKFFDKNPDNRSILYGLDGTRKRICSDHGDKVVWNEAIGAYQLSDKDYKKNLDKLKRRKLKLQQKLDTLDEEINTLKESRKKLKANK